MSDRSPELGPEFALAEQAEPIRARGEGLTVESLKNELRQQRNERYRGLIRRIKDTYAKGMIERESRDDFTERLRSVCLSELGEGEAEYVCPPPPPTAEEMAGLLEDLRSQGYRIRRIFRPEDYQCRNGRITGVVEVGVQEPSSDHIVIRTLPIEDGKILVGDSFQIDARPSESHIITGAEQFLTKNGRRFGVISRWRDGARNLPLVADRVVTEIDGRRILTCLGLIFHDDHSWSGIVGTRDDDPDTRIERYRNNLVVHGKRLRELAGLEFGPIERLEPPLVVDDEGRVTILKKPSIPVVKNEVLKEIDGQPIRGTQWFIPSETSYSGVFELTNGAIAIIVEGERIDPFPDSTVSRVEQFQVQDGLMSGYFRLQGGSHILMANGKIWDLSDQLPEGTIFFDIHQMSVSPAGRPSGLITAHLGADKWEKHYFLVDGELKEKIAGISVDKVGGVQDFTIFDGRANFTVPSKEERGAIHVVLDEISHEDEIWL